MMRMGSRSRSRSLRSHFRDSGFRIRVPVRVPVHSRVVRAFLCALILKMLQSEKKQQVQQRTWNVDSFDNEVNILSMSQTSK